MKTCYIILFAILEYLGKRPFENDVSTKGGGDFDLLIFYEMRDRGVWMMMTSIFIY